MLCCVMLCYTNFLVFEEAIAFTQGVFTGC